MSFLSSRANKNNRKWYLEDILPEEQKNITQFKNIVNRIHIDVNGQKLFHFESKNAVNLHCRRNFPPFQFITVEIQNIYRFGGGKSFSVR